MRKTSSIVLLAAAFGCVLEITSSPPPAPPSNKLKLTLFYESLCPFSVKFIVKQLEPVTRAYGDLLDLDLVPFGYTRAEEEPNGTWNFRCQHGARECYGNRVHACVLDQQSGAVNKTQTVGALACLMSTSDYSDYSLRKCLGMEKLSVDMLQSCLKNRADELEVAYGKRTLGNVPKVKFVPFIMFGDNYDAKQEDLATNNLEYIVCELLGNERPSACTKFY